MKKLYKKSTVHPSPPPPPPPPPISDHLSLLPAAIFTLTLALSSQDKEVLAYLLSSSTTKKTTTTTTSSAAADHPPLFSCSCFRCYMSYWVRWDSSPNRQLIHEIIDALEDGLVRNKKEKSKKDRKKKVISNSSSNEETRSTESDELTQSPEVSRAKLESVVECGGGGGGGGDGEEEGPVRKLVSYIWSVWT